MYAFLEGGAPRKFGRPKLSKIGRDFGQLWISIANHPERIGISKIGKGSNHPAFDEKMFKLCSTNKKVIGAHVDPPMINTARAV